MNKKGEKSEIREILIKRRMALSPEYAASASEMICGYVLNTDEYSRAQTVMLYYPDGSEADTRRIIEHSIKVEKRVVLPVCVRNRMLEAYQVKDKCELKKGRYGSMEPDTEICPIVLPEEINLIIVPGVAFDVLRNRMGRGAGYYDNFLPTAKNAFCMGVCYSFQLMDKIPVSPWDYVMDAVVCEKEIIGMNY